MRRETNFLVGFSTVVKGFTRVMLIGWFARSIAVGAACMQRVSFTGFIGDFMGKVSHVAGYEVTELLVAGIEVCLAL